MNLKILILSSMLIASSHAHGAIGCMDNSERLQKTGDSKSYHYVACTCPCQRYKQIADRNKCSKCNHFHDTQPYIIISGKKNAPSSKTTAHVHATNCKI